MVAHRLVVGAHYGLRDWLAQRITGVIMAAYTLLFLAVLLTTPMINFSTWRTLFSPQWMKFATLLFAAALFWHAWIGMRNIFMDYVKNGAVRLVLFVIVIGLLIVYGAWSVQILWSI